MVRNFKRYLSALTLVTLAACLPGCATARPLATPSGKPEMFFSGLTRPQAVNLMSNAILSAGATVRLITEYQVIMEQPTSNWFAIGLLSSRAGGAPIERLIVHFAEVTGGTRAVFTLQYVSNAGTAFEKTIDISHSPMAHAIQHKLQGTDYQPR